MNKLRRAAVLASLDARLRERGSWCGETHLQKGTFFLQEFMGVPTGFVFILFKHGPFSFELRDELTAMRADGFLELVPREPYGPSLILTSRAQALMKLFPKTLKRYGKRTEFVADNLGGKNVIELEKLATALYVRLASKQRSPKKNAEDIHVLKPHVSLDDAMQAVKELDGLVAAKRRHRFA